MNIARQLKMCKTTHLAKKKKKIRKTFTSTAPVIGMWKHTIFSEGKKIQEVKRYTNIKEKPVKSF